MENLTPADCTLQNFSVELRLEDWAWAAHRPLYHTRLRQAGDRMLIQASPLRPKLQRKFSPQADEAASKTYFVSLSQESFPAMAGPESCTIYPSQEHSSYADCDIQWVNLDTVFACTLLCWAGGLSVLQLHPDLRNAELELGHRIQARQTGVSPR